MKLLITIPVYNEEVIVEKSLKKLYTFLDKNLSNYDWQIVVSDNNSNDQTAAIVKRMSQDIPKIKHFYLTQKGKGIAIKKAWQNFNSDIYCFMDADLATDLNALPNLIDAIKQGEYDIAIGSRYLKESKTQRSFARKIVSFSYRIITKIIIGTKITDPPCGFKAVSSKVIEEVLDIVKNEEWFFDNELVFLAEKMGFKIKEIPIVWQDHQERDSKVNIVKQSWQYLQNLLELKLRLSKNIYGKKQ